jgi:DNA-binding response OmpR family regulator
VGRSLDMFISKLRKKLELDPNIKIVVIRGKGYKLEINTLENARNIYLL